MTKYVIFEPTYDRSFITMQKSGAVARFIKILDRGVILPPQPFNVHGKAQP